MSGSAFGVANRHVALRGIAAIGIVCSASSILQAKDASSRPEGDIENRSEESEGIVFERQQIMQQLGRDSELLGKIVAGTAPTDGLGEVTRSVAQGAKDAVVSFREAMPGGRSKPEVWANYGDFMERMEAFARNADKLAQAGESGNVAGVTAVMIDALPCKQCHDVYREPKKP